MAARASGKWQFHLGSLNQCWVLQTNSFHLSLLASVEHCLRHHQEQQKDGAADDENKRESNGKIYIYIFVAQLQWVHSCGLQYSTSKQEGPKQMCEWFKACL